MSELGKEKALRAHIRNLLHDYALTHLTKDYIEFTETAVNNLLSECLRKIPTTDPHSLVLPSDPFDILTQTYELASLEPYDEKWSADQEILQYVINNTRFPGKAKTERCWAEEDDFNYEHSMYRPMSPELTIRAIHQTPRLGNNGFLNSLPSSYSAFLASNSLKSVEVEIIEEEPKVKLEDALSLRLGVDNKTHADMLTLLTSTGALRRPNPKYTNPHVDAFLRGDFPSTGYVRPESPFIPLFPRDRMPGSVASMAGQPHPSGLESISDLPSRVVDVKLEDEDPDLYKEHMIIVDGWQTYKSSSPPSPSTPVSSQGEGVDQLDELFKFSSPNTDPAPIRELMDAKMDEVEMPWTTKIGGAREKPKPLGSGKDLSSFLLPCISSLQPTASPSMKFRPSSPQQSVSMVGEPPSAASGCDEPDASCISAERDVEDDSLGDILAKVCRDVQGQNPTDPILYEKLNEKDGLLMEVPTLLPPNAHSPSGVFLPTNLQNLAIPPKRQKNAGANHEPKAIHPGFLRKAKGIQCLNMELSWVPFKFGPKVPTDEEVAGVCNVMAEELDSEGTEGADQLRHLFKQAAVTDFDGGSGAGYLPCRDHWADDGSLGRKDDGCEMILTRRERRRLSGIPLKDEYLNSQDDENSSDKENQEGFVSHLSPAESDSQRPTKRPRLQCDSYHPQGIDDSGISFLSNIITPDEFSLTPGGPHLDDSNIYSLDADKENVPLASGFDSDIIYNADFARYTIDQSYEDQREPKSDLGDHYHDEPEGHAYPTSSTGETDMECRGFLPLSFDSHQALASQPAPIRAQEDLGPQSSIPAAIIANGPETLIPQDILVDPCLDTRSPTSAITLPSVGIAKFMELRSKQSTAKIQHPDLSEEDHPVAVTNHATELCLPLEVPEKLFDGNTVRLPSPWLHPPTVHRYMASMDVVHKRSLVRSLRSPQCAVDFVERDTLNGVDLILDPHSAIIFVSLLALPSQCEGLVAQLGQQSWHYSRLLVIFETYPGSQAYTSKLPTGPAPYPFSPPILKALNRLRRDLVIAEACDNKCAATDVRFAFAGTVDEAAMFVRFFGQLAEECDETQGAIWDNREWLDAEAHEDEGDMAAVDGMNVFAAAIILCQMSVTDFLDLPAEARLSEFGLLVGVPRMELLNDVIARRSEAMELELSVPSGDYGD